MKNSTSVSYKGVSYKTRLRVVYFTRLQSLHVLMHDQVFYCNTYTLFLGPQAVSKELGTQTVIDMRDIEKMFEKLSLEQIKKSEPPHPTISQKY